MPIPEDSISPHRSYPVKNPTIQIVLDCHGEPVLRSHLNYALRCLENLIGSEKAYQSFWMTRTDLLHGFIERNYKEMMLSEKEIGDDRFHEPSFDLYLQGEIVPCVRLVNVAPTRNAFGDEVKR